MAHDHPLTEQERGTYTLELYDEIKALYPPKQEEQQTERQRMATELFALVSEDRRPEAQRLLDLIGISFWVETIEAYGDGFRDGFVRGSESMGPIQ
jgi:hypothetical protein